MLVLGERALHSLRRRNLNLSSLSLIDFLLAVALTSVNSALSFKSWPTVSKPPILTESSRFPGSLITLMRPILTRQFRGVWRTGAEKQRKISSVSLAVHIGLTLSLYQAPALSTLLRAVLQQVLHRLSSLGLPHLAPPLPHLQLTDLHHQPPHQALDLCQASPPAALHLCLPKSPLRSRQNSASGRTAWL